MSKNNKLTLEEHMQIAEHLACVNFHMKEIDRICIQSFNKTSSLYKQIRKWSGNTGYLVTIQSCLDDEFHHSIDKKQWEKLNTEGDGHIYYNLDKRLPKDYVKSFREYRKGNI